MALRVVAAGWGGLAVLILDLSRSAFRLRLPEESKLAVNLALHDVRMQGHASLQCGLRGKACA